MNWDAIGAIAELAGAIGVILSLAYLAVQIRLNTKQMESTARAARGAAYQNVLTTYQSYLTPVAANAELADIFQRGLMDSQQLTESEFFRFNWLLGGYLTNLDNSFYQRQDGVVSEERWQVLLTQLRYFVRAPGFKDWWQGWDDSTVAPEFARIVESEVKALENAP